MGFKKEHIIQIYPYDILAANLDSVNEAVKGLYSSHRCSGTVTAIPVHRVKVLLARRQLQTMLPSIKSRGMLTLSSSHLEVMGITKRRGFTSTTVGNRDHGATLGQTPSPTPDPTGYNTTKYTLWDICLSTIVMGKTLIFELKE